MVHHGRTAVHIIRVYLTNNIIFKMQLLLLIITEVRNVCLTETEDDCNENGTSLKTDKNSSEKPNYCTLKRYHIDAGRLFSAKMSKGTCNHHDYFVGGHLHVATTFHAFVFVSKPYVTQTMLMCFDYKVRPVEIPNFSI